MQVPHNATQSFRAAAIGNLMLLMHRADANQRLQSSSARSGLGATGTCNRPAHDQGKLTTRSCMIPFVPANSKGPGSAGKPVY